MKNIAIFASGNGSNFEAIALAVQHGEINASVSLLVCDKPGARVVSRAEFYRIETVVFSPKDYADKVAYEAEILSQLQARDVQFLVLAGYMRLIGKTLLEAYPKRIVNIHPSLLPHFPGKGAIGQAYRSGRRETGVSVHYVDEGMDTGPVITQCTVEIKAGDSLETLERNIHRAEHALYIQTLKELFRTE